MANSFKNDLSTDKSLNLKEEYQNTQIQRVIDILARSKKRYIV